MTETGLRYREVKCPWCKHIFMWLKGSGDGSYYVYYNKMTKEHMETAKCPDCGKPMIVLDHVLVGVDTDDDSFEKGTVRGL